MTRLEMFLRSHPNVARIDLAREANCARQHLLRTIRGLQEPRRKIIAAYVSALRRLTLEPIGAEDVFELTSEESGAWQRRRSILLERLSIDQLAGEWVRAYCKGISEVPWVGLLASRLELIDESLVRVLILEGRSAIDDNPARAAAFGRFAVTVSARVKSPSAKFLIHLRGCAEVLHANALRHLGEYSEAIDAVNRAEAVLTLHVMSANDLAQAWYVRGIVLWKRGDFESATRFARRAAILFELLGDFRRLAYTNVLEASIEFERGDPARAREILLSVLAPLKRAEDRRGLASAWLSLGTAEGQLGNIDEAKRWLGVAAKAFERLRVKPEMIRATWCLGYFVGLLEDRRRGLQLIRKAKDEFEQLGMSIEAGFASLDLAEVLLVTSEGASEAAQVCERIYALFHAAGARPAAEKTLAYLRDAALKSQVTTQLVKAVRKHLHVMKRNPAAMFDPDAAE